MIGANDLLVHAARLLASPGLTAPPAEEVDRRRAISAAYYGVFHTLTQSAKLLLDGHPGGLPEEIAVWNERTGLLAGQVSRAFNHGTMKKVCAMYVRGRTQPFPAPYSKLIARPPLPALTSVAQSFMTLQEARHEADYNLRHEVTELEAVRLVRLAISAAEDWSKLRGSVDAATFLTVLLLHDLWARRA